MAEHFGYQEPAPVSTELAMSSLSTPEVLPLGPRVLLRRLDPSTSSTLNTTGFVIPDANREKATECEVVAIPSSSYLTEFGTTLRCPVLPGDTVLIGKYSGSEHKVRNAEGKEEELLFVRWEELLGVKPRRGKVEDTKAERADYYVGDEEHKEIDANSLLTKLRDQEEQRRRQKRLGMFDDPGVHATEIARWPGLPSAADLDAVAAEQTSASKTSTQDLYNEACRITNERIKEHFASTPPTQVVENFEAIISAEQTVAERNAACPECHGLWVHTSSCSLGQNRKDSNF